jgi:hypothetical protein
MRRPQQAASEIADAALHACANVQAVREFLGRQESPKPTLQTARQLLEEGARRMAIWMVLHIRYPER